MEELQNPVITVDEVNYDTSKASEATQAMIQDITTVQGKMNDYKVQYDIAGIARQSLIDKIKEMVESGESGLVAIEDETTESESTTDTEEGK